MPTPAARATASRLASAPPALKTAFAASSTRSRLRTASTRGFRVLLSDSLMPSAPRMGAWNTEAHFAYQVENTLTHNTRVEQTARPCLRRHAGAHPRVDRQGQ